MREKPLILIVDDEKDIREMLKIKLEASGFDIKEATCGAEALKLAKEIKPDIMILDIVMPDIDGVEVFINLKKDAETKNIKIFFFTGKGEPKRQLIDIDKKFAEEMGAADFIKKEIDLNELVQKLNNAWQQILRMAPKQYNDLK